MKTVEHIRKADMAQWTISTRSFGTLEAAINDAQAFVPRAHLIIWPMSQNYWLVIIGTHGTVN